jgi:hypothetical protein
MGHAEVSAWVCPVEDGHVGGNPQVGHHCCFCLNVRSPARKPKTTAAVVIMSSATATPFILLVDADILRPGEPSRLVRNAFALVGIDARPAS